jgi:hypothetical protein
MNHPARVAIATLGVVGALAVGGLVFTQARAAEETAENQPTVVTLYISDGSAKGLAEAATKAHAKYVASGYAFADFESYTEDGDLKGGWVTYVKK